MNQHSSPKEKIACFAALFRGRTDVYPQRFENQKTGRAGYSPACSNEWVRSVCEKPRIKCSNCSRQDWIPVTERCIKWHLSGKDSSGYPFVMGVYPMLLDESCHFLAIDLDGEDWQSDALALITIIKQLNLPVALERSRSGNGGHLWFFFEHSIPAVQARRFGTHLLTEAIELRPEIGLSSYDRMFPNQDTLPKGRFGNLIALPLQKAARDAGNSAFIDEQFEPYPDQWAFLAQIQRISAAKITELVTAAARTNRILPIRMPPSDEFALEPWRAPPSGKAKESQIDVALIQSLVRKDVVDDRIADYGHIIIDECHHLSAHSFERAISQAKGKYVLGLSATVQRKDGHQPIIFMQCGPVRHRVNAKDQAKDRPFQHHVIVRPTAFNASHEPEDNARMEFQLLYKSLINDEIRNTQIVSDVCQAIQANRNPLILTERTEHLEYLNTQLQAAGLKTVVLQGGLNKTQFTAAMELLNQDRKEPVVVIATGRYVGEGFDCCKLDTLFVTLPVSWQGTVAQYVGRLHRLHDGKKVVQVYDYADLNVPMLARMFDKRCAGYEAVGYSILLPASALPGWPVEVPLPVDPLWKKDYSGSVKRLLQDGVDPPLAQLFVQTATPQSNESRARSASEAFFFKRLETLPETKGQFKLNATFNIPFNQNGTMEVDFLCEAAKLVIELDGSQHLQDEAAWRSDRRKDMRLQMHGYFVLRLLATDLAKRLPTALDQVLSVLTHCQNKQ